MKKDPLTLMSKGERIQEKVNKTKIEMKKIPMIGGALIGGA